MSIEDFFSTRENDDNQTIRDFEFVNNDESNADVLAEFCMNRMKVKIESKAYNPYYMKKMNVLTNLYTTTNNKQYVIGMTYLLMEMDGNEVKIDKYLDKLLKFYDKNTTDFDKINFNSKDVSILIYGKPQSGKSTHSERIAHIHQLLGHQVIYITRNLRTDVVKTCNTFSRISKSDDKEFRSSNPGIDTKPIKVIGYKSGCNKGKLLAEMKQYIKPVIVGQYHNSHLNTICGLIKELNKTNPKTRVCIMVDEADFNSYNPNVTTTAFNDLCSLTNHKYEITATPKDVLYGNKKLENGNIIRVTPTSTYHDLTSVKLFGLPSTLNTKKKGTIYNTVEDMHKVDPLINYTYETLGKKHAFEEGDHGLNHPIVILHKDCQLKDTHTTFCNYIASSEGTSMWTVIKEDGDGIVMNTSRIDTDIVITDNTIHSNYIECGFYEYDFSKSDVTIPEILQYLKDNGGVEIFSHIVIKSGRQASRGNSYVSTDGEWHLSHMFYRMPKKPSVADAIQSISRILHDRPDNIPLEVITEEITLKEIRIAYAQTDEEISRMINHDETTTTATFMENMEVSKTKLPKHLKLMNGKANEGYRPNVIDGQDGGSLLKNFSNEVKVEKGEIEEDGDDISDKYKFGNMIHPPGVGTQRRIVYDQIINYLKSKKHRWIPLVEIREFLRINTKIQQIGLQDTGYADFGNTGLIWRQPRGVNTSIDYCLN